MARGDHFSGCVWNYPDCPCIRCARDGEADSRGGFCCEKHKRFCDGEPCKDFIEETEGEIDV